ncbi:MAG: hypothetical protein GYB31_01150 [Bacteroidetes bacterium]|nr:hypothetical protein [Bacteroidota bacterium]
MKRFKNPLFALLFLIPISFTNSSCCDDLLALCDLVVDAFTAPDQITLGQVIDLAADVFNDPDSDDCTGTEIAAATTSLIEVFLDSGNGYQPYDFFPLNQDAIDPSQYGYFDVGFTPNEAGSYRFDFYTDDAFLVAERSESNNIWSLGGRFKEEIEIRPRGNNVASVYVEVLPAPDGRTNLDTEAVFELR